MRNKNRPLRIYRDEKGNEYLILENKKIRLDEIPEQILNKIISLKKYPTNKRKPLLTKKQIYDTYKTKLKKGRTGKPRSFYNKSYQKYDDNKDLVKKIDTILDIFKTYFKENNKKEEKKEENKEDKKIDNLMIGYKKDVDESIVNMKKDMIDIMEKKLEKRNEDVKQLGFAMLDEEKKKREALEREREANDEKNKLEIYNKALEEIKKQNEKDNKDLFEELRNFRIDSVNRSFEVGKDKLAEKKNLTKDLFNYMKSSNINQNFSQKKFDERYRLKEERKNLIEKLIEEDKKKVLDFMITQNIIEERDKNIEEYLLDKQLGEVKKNVIEDIENKQESNEDIGEFGEDLPKEGKGKNKHQGGLFDFDINNLMSSLPNFYGAISENDLDETLKKIGIDKPNIFSFVYLLHNEKEYNGGHWVGIYCDTKDNKECDYFNSFGEDAPNFLKNKIKNILENYYNLPYMIKWKYNTHTLQLYSSSLCGLITSWVIYQLYFGVPFKIATDHDKYKLNSEMKKAYVNFGFI